MFALNWVTVKLRFVTGYIVRTVLNGRDRDRFQFSFEETAENNELCVCTAIPAR